MESLLDDDFVQNNGAVEDGYAAHLVRFLRRRPPNVHPFPSLYMATRHLSPTKEKKSPHKMIQRLLLYV